MDDLLNELARDIDKTCRLTGTFTLRSGQVATEYFDKYLFESDPRLLRRVAESMVPLIPKDATLALREAGATVHTVMCAIDRGTNPGKALEDVDLTTRYLLTRADLDRAHE